jgi:hypothetical protein
MNTSKRLYHLALLLFILLNASTISEASPSKIPVIHIEAASSAAIEIGLNVGRKTKALFPDIEQRYDTHLASVLSRSEFENIVRNRLPKLMNSLDKSYQDEFKGVAGTWAFANKSIPGDGELSLDEYRILNLLPDLGFSPNGSGFGVFKQTAVDYAPIVGRNLDWKGTEELLSLQVVTVYHFDDVDVVNIGFAGMLSVLSGFNTDGLFVSAINAAPYTPYQRRAKSDNHPNSSAFDLRRLLETRSSIKHASQFLSGRKYGFDMNILLADKEAIKTLEYPIERSPKLREWDSPTHREQRWRRKSQLAVVDCFVLLASPRNCKTPMNMVRWKRFEELAIFKPTLLADMNNISSIMFDRSNHNYEIFNQQTIQSMVYKPENNSLYLYAANELGKHPKNLAHQVYLDLLPPREKGFSLLDIKLKWLVWGLLICLLGLVAWQIRKSTGKA